MSFSGPIQWYHSHADPIWPDGTFNAVKICPPPHRKIQGLLYYSYSRDACI